MPVFHLRNRPRLAAAVVIGAVVAAVLPPPLHAHTRLLLGWNAGTWLYLLLTWRLMAKADHGSLRRIAAAHGEGALAVLAAAVAAIAVTFAAIVLELSGAHGHTGVAWPQLLLMVTTLVGSWLLLATLFATSYASLYYSNGDAPGSGLEFPGRDDDGPPTYGDFMYFSLTLAATSQTSDVAVSRRIVRRWVLAQAVLSFAFNTLLLALAINSVAGLF